MKKSVTSPLNPNLRTLTTFSCNRMSKQTLAVRYTVTSSASHYISVIILLLAVHWQWNLSATFLLKILASEWQTFFWKDSKNCNCQVTWPAFSIKIVLVVLESLPSVMCSTTIHSDVHCNTTRNAKLPWGHKALNALSDIFWLINGEAVAHSTDDISFKYNFFFLKKSFPFWIFLAHSYHHVPVIPVNILYYNISNTMSSNFQDICYGYQDMQQKLSSCPQHNE